MGVIGKAKPLDRSTYNLLFSYHLPNFLICVLYWLNFDRTPLDFGIFTNWFIFPYYEIKHVARFFCRRNEFQTLLFTPLYFDFLWEIILQCMPSNKATGHCSVSVQCLGTRTLDNVVNSFQLKIVVVILWSLRSRCDACWSISATILSW